MKRPIYSPVVESEPLSKILLGPLANRANRLSLLIQKQIGDATGFAAFEPDTPDLWSHLRQTIENLLQSLFLQGAFVGTKPDEAYEVRCDATTMTHQDINLGRIQIVVGFAPIKPAEFTLLHIAIQAQPPA